MVTMYIQATNLISQLEIMGNNISDNNGGIVEIKNHLQQLTATERELMKTTFVLPATNVTSERAMWRMKSYLWSTMTQGRPNHLMILHVHKKLILVWLLRWR